MRTLVRLVQSLVLYHDVFDELRCVRAEVLAMIAVKEHHLEAYELLSQVFEHILRSLQVVDTIEVVAIVRDHS